MEASSNLKRQQKSYGGGSTRSRTATKDLERKLI